ncbi:hypothetical protein [Nocardia vaccinii]|uniref:hypothetical protein n=1 Tax=Nocardia vaccinii TaxID=1822 RepID=UPI00082EB6B5|nr:hypothetical protein [Nocardia vaccinii]
MTSIRKLAVGLVVAAVSVVALAGTAQGGQDTAVHRHEGATECIRWWWTDSGTPTTTIHWRNLCPTSRKLMVSWQNHRTNRNPDDVLYEISGGSEGSDTWAGIPIAFRQL